jgi:DNA-binding MarR family transcriptional regulator
MTRPKVILIPVTPHAEGDTDIGDIKNIVGFHIRLAHGAVYRHFTEAFSDLELTQKQVSVLWLVDDHPDIAQIGLAKRMQMDRATTMAIINRLQKRGFLVRGKSKTDGRKQTLNLTNDGRQALASAKVAIQKHEKWLQSRFSKKEVEMLIEMLSRFNTE